ncbi:uncharacterized protein LOC133173723 [Saccostrea echinata]|uniref:uncharacterized protein LOC133173723 n=1 Tax=Saccostrea echinata TaxID=191078 RepID=UPI002A839850|nr:uncharacterized protein LOC133173723 [Saccostrea echinata]
MAFDFKRAQEFWNEQARFEGQKNFDLRHQHGKGPSNIFILDTSSSLGEDGFKQMKEIFSAVIDEYANHPDMDENVAVIICGRNTRFQHYYSNQYSDIKHCLDDIDFGGSSPLTAAFFLATGCLQNGAAHTRRIGDFRVHPRIILISDGKPTDFTVVSDADDVLPYATEMDKDHLIQLTRGIGERHPIFCIPIGNNPDLTFLEYLSAQSRGGKIVHPREIRQFAKYTENLTSAALLPFTMKNDGSDREMVLTLLACELPWKEFTEMDQDDIFEICSKKSLYSSWEDIRTEISDEAFEERDRRMPPLGSRVKRGRDWKWNNQDSFGPGTVTGHQKDAGWLNVEWDTGFKYGYRYGTNSTEIDKYDVTICEEPRILENEMIATGCLVTRGPDWERGDQDGGDGSIGTVYRVKGNGVAHVRWENGQMSDYRFGFRGKFDLQICDPFSPEATRYLQDQKRKAATICPVNESFIDVNENAFSTALTTGSCSSAHDHNLKSEKTCENPVDSPPILKIPKGKYFKNDRMNDELSDIEVDGTLNSLTSNTVDQWFWKDDDGKWIPYPRKMNDKINRCYKRNPSSTVIVTIKDHTYRVVMAKHVHINLTTRGESKVKFVKSDL